MSKQAILHLSKDKKLKKAIEACDELLQLEVRNDLYLHLIRSIVGQQLSVKAAQTIYNRFAALFKKSYPHPRQLLAMDLETLRSAGLSRQKAGYVKNVADYFLSNKLLKKDWSIHTDDEVLTMLTEIKGVGVWTSQMILMFTLARPDIFPVDDVGIQNAMRKLYGIEETGKTFKQRLIALSDKWQPYRTYACYYLWRYLDAK